jgi:hypothetical protein
MRSSLRHVGTIAARTSRLLRFLRADPACAPLHRQGSRTEIRRLAAPYRPRPIRSVPKLEQDRLFELRCRRNLSPMFPGATEGSRIRIAVKASPPPVDTSGGALSILFLSGARYFSPSHTHPASRRCDRVVRLSRLSQRLCIDLASTPYWEGVRSGARRLAPSFILIPATVHGSGASSSALPLEFACRRNLPAYVPHT